MSGAIITVYIISPRILFSCSKGTACNRKGYGCKWTWETIKHNTWTQIIVREQRLYCTATFDSLCRFFNNEHNSYPKVRETAFAVQCYSMIFAIYNCISQIRGNQQEPAKTVKCSSAIQSLFPHYNLCPSVMFDSLSCSFTPISFPITSCSLTVICV
jgi:hypothetical protein